MRKHYSRTEAAATPALTIERARTFLRIDVTETDPELVGFIAACTRYVEDNTGRVLSEQQFRLSADAWPSGCTWNARSISLDRTPLVTVESVKYYPADGGAQATLATSNYGVFTDSEPGLVWFKPDATLPCLADRPDAIQIAFTSGNAEPDDVDERLIHAINLLVADADTMRVATITGTIVAANPRMTDLMTSLRTGGFVA